MQDVERFKLRFGKYRTPQFRYGAIVQCQVRGEMVITGLSSGRIPWPIGRPPKTPGGRSSLVIYKGLAKAVRHEAAQAVQHWWGVGRNTVWTWRKSLNVPANSNGTTKLRKLYGREEWFLAAQRKAWSVARAPERRAKIASSKRGKKRPPDVVEAMRRRQLGKRLGPETREKMRAAHQARGTRPPWLNPAWEPWEDELLQRLPRAEAAIRTGRSMIAVSARRHHLQLPDARRSKHAAVVV